MSRPKHTAENMRRRVLLLLAVLIISLSSSIQAQVPKPPASRVDNFREVIHGVEIINSYRWLDDPESP